MPSLPCGNRSNPLLFKGTSFVVFICSSYSPPTTAPNYILSPGSAQFCTQPSPFSCLLTCDPLHCLPLCTFGSCPVSPTARQSFAESSCYKERTFILAHGFGVARSRMHLVTVTLGLLKSLALLAACISAGLFPWPADSFLARFPHAFSFP